MKRSNTLAALIVEPAPIQARYSRIRVQLAALATLSVATLGSLMAAVAPPSIDYQPRSETVIVYQQAAFGVIANGSTPLSYQWHKDGVPIHGATNDQIVLAQAHFSDSGLYSVVVSNLEGSVTSTGAALTVNPPRAGDVDFSFVWGGSINGDVRCVAVQPDGKILIGGDFTTVHRAVRGGIARLNADGSTDYTFMNGLAGVPWSWGDTGINSVAVQSDGKILIGGFFSMVNGMSRNSIARLNPDGTLDSAFQGVVAGPNGIRSIVLQNDGKVLIGGYFTSITGVNRVGIARLDPDGTLDSGFQTTLSGWSSAATSIALQTDGKVLIAGQFFAVNGMPTAIMARLNADGTLDSGFQPQLAPGSDFVSSIVVQRDGKVLIAGDRNVNGEIRSNIARLNPDGTPDSTFQSSLAGAAYATSSITVQSDGKILVARGQQGFIGGASWGSLARLNPDGSVDQGFSLTTVGPILAVAELTDRTLLVGGSFITLNGERHNLVRLNPDGTLDSGFQHPFSGPDFADPQDSSPDTFSSVDSMAVQSDGKVLIGGAFDVIQGVKRDGLARLNADGSLDSGFQVGLSNNACFFFCPWLPRVSAIALQSPDKVLIGGRFSIVNAVPASILARLNPDGGLDNAFQNGHSAGGLQVVNSIATQNGGAMIIVIGNAVSFGLDPPTEQILRLNAGGVVDMAFLKASSGVDGRISTVAVQDDGKVLIAGGFTRVNGMNATNIARLNTDGTLDGGFHGPLLEPGATLDISAIAMQSDSKILIGEAIERVNGVASSLKVARLNRDGTLDSTFHTEKLFGSSISSIVAQENGQVLIAGAFTTPKPEGRGMARLNADGSLDPSFQTAISSDHIYDPEIRNVNSVVVQSDGKILVGGYFSIINGAPAARIARLWGSVDVPPRIQNVNRRDAQTHLTWGALPSRTYRVQFKDAISAETWMDLTEDVTGSTTGEASKTDLGPGNAGERFYRVVLLP